MAHTQAQERLLAWIDAHFDEEVAFLQDMIRVPTDTPPGDNAPHADMVAEKVQAYGWQAEKHAVPAQQVRDYGMQSITNVIVRRPYGDGGPTIALNAHGDVVPPGEGWSKPPYGAVVEDGVIYGRAAAVSKSDFATYVFAARALEALGVPLKGALELHFTYDEEFGGLLGPGWLLEQKLTEPDLVIAAGFAYNIVTAHNACLQLEITVHGKAGHGAMPETAVDALQAATRILNAIYGQLPELKKIKSTVPGIDSPTMLVGRIDGGTNTNVVPGKVVHLHDHLARHPPGDSAPAAVAGLAPAAGVRQAGGQPAAPRAHNHRGGHPGARHPAVRRCAPVWRARHPGRAVRRRSAHGARIERQKGR
jgi:succinyl-diaminopimelate desuccinylase